MQAVFWYRKAAEQGDSDAHCNLGWCYGTGTGVEQNAKEAIKWYQESAEKGNMVAQYNLGFYYENGKGVDQDFEQSKTWYQKAAEQGYSEAKEKLESLSAIEKEVSSYKSQGFSKAQAQLDGFKQISQTFDVFLNDFSSDTKISLIAAISQFLPSGSMEEAEKLIDSDHVAIARGVDFEKMKLICSAIEKCGGKAGVIVNY